MFAVPWGLGAAADTASVAIFSYRLVYFRLVVAVVHKVESRTRTLMTGNFVVVAQIKDPSLEACIRGDIEPGLINKQTTACSISY